MSRLAQILLKLAKLLVLTESGSKFRCLGIGHYLSPGGGSRRVLGGGSLDF